MDPLRPGGGPASLRRMHRGLALRKILVAGGASRTRLAARLGLSQMAASRIVRDLMDAGLVEEAGTATRESGPGRHQTLLRIRPNGAFAASIVLSAYSTEIGIADATGTMVAQRNVRVGRFAEGAKVIATLAAALNRLIDDMALPRQRILGVGIAVAAQLDLTRRRVLSAGYLGLRPFDLVEPVERITGLPVHAENIVNATALAEITLGVVRNLHNVAVVRAATLPGAAIMQNGRIIRGDDANAGRIGHLPHVKTQLICSCGRSDCLNCSASGWSILVDLGLVKERRYLPRRVKAYASAIEELIEAGNGSGKAAADERDRALRKAGSALSKALKTLHLLLDPDAIVLSGPLVRAHAYVEEIERGLQRLGEFGVGALRKLRIGEIRAIRAAAIMVLLERVYSSSLDFEALCASVDASNDARILTGTSE